VLWLLRTRASNVAGRTRWRQSKTGRIFSPERSAVEPEIRQRLRGEAREPGGVSV